MTLFTNSEEKFSLYGNRCASENVLSRLVSREGLLCWQQACTSGGAVSDASFSSYSPSRHLKCTLAAYSKTSLSPLMRVLPLITLSPLLGLSKQSKQQNVSVLPSPDAGRRRRREKRHSADLVENNWGGRLFRWGAAVPNTNAAHPPTPLLMHRGEERRASLCQSTTRRVGATHASTAPAADTINTVDCNLVCEKKKNTQKDPHTRQL